MKVYTVVQVYIHIFLATELGGSDWSASCCGNFAFGVKALSTFLIGGWMSLVAGLSFVSEKNLVAAKNVAQCHMTCENIQI